MDTKLTPGRRPRRPNFPIALKRQLAQQASQPGISVSRLAQEHGINVNMLFKWRRELAAGVLGASQRNQVMLPVALVDESAPHAKHKRRTAGLASAADTDTHSTGIIEIQLAHATLRCDSNVNLATLGAVMRMLQA